RTPTPALITDSTADVVKLVDTHV
ncbi:MAG: hypothetical protein RLZZ488_1553, partial [Pseudomonadota bacterium]